LRRRRNWRVAVIALELRGNVDCRSLDCVLHKKIKVEVAGKVSILIPAFRLTDTVPQPTSIPCDDFTANSAASQPFLKVLTATKTLIEVTAVRLYAKNKDPCG
jgi:hypothetical protein